MKKLIAMIVSMIIISPVFAAGNGFALVGVKMSLPANEKTHYLCIYDVGCLNIGAVNNTKVFPIALGGMANIKKLVITDVSKKHLAFQTLPSSCAVMLKANQEITIQGALVNGNKGSEIRNLHCTIAEKAVQGEMQHV